MLELINAISIFGHTVNLDVNTAMFWLLVIQGALILIEITVFCILILRANRKKNAGPRDLVCIMLDTGIIKREFTVGDAFDCDGLLIYAQYNAAPTVEIVPSYSVVDVDPPQGTLGCFVIRPDLSVAGKRTVTVRYNDKYTVYPISVEEQPVAEPQEERTLLAIALNTDNVQKEFTVGDVFNHDGLQVTAVFNTEPTEEPVEDYTVFAPDLSVAGERDVIVRYNDKYTVYFISVKEQPVAEPQEERALLAIALNTDNVQKEFTVGDVFNHDGLQVTAMFNTEPTEEPVEDYTVFAPDMSKEGSHAVTVAYWDKSADYRITVKGIIEEPIPVAQPADEESYTESTIRYNKSFQARFIQSDEEIQVWYGELKNDFLSYKNVKDRMSWKRESYRMGRDCVARISFRGKTLCVYFPIDPADLEGSKYKVEDASDNSSYADTPCLYRIKNERRMEYAKELMKLVMERYGAVRKEREPIDYSMPYETDEALLEKKLIKCNIVEGVVYGEVAAAAEESAPVDTTDRNRF